MSTKSRGTNHKTDLKRLSISFFGLLIVINSAKATVDYEAFRKDDIAHGTTRGSARTTRDILEELLHRNVTSVDSLQHGTEHLLQYGALLRTQILDTFGKLVYDHYDDFGMSQIEALYRVYRETLERKYNIFDIVPRVLDDPDTRPTKICRYINEHIRTCLKESSRTCMNIMIHDEPHEDTLSKPALNVTRQIYELTKIPTYYPRGFSPTAVLRYLRSGKLRFTPALFSGLLHNAEYDSFDDKVRTAERELVSFLTRTPGGFSEETERAAANAGTIGGLLQNYLTIGENIFKGNVIRHADYLAEHVVREVDAISKNIELLGTVYDNSTINLEYLFELILPNDTMDDDILDARNYLLRQIRNKKIVQNYLRVEKYQQAGPDQLIMEIFGQLRDIHFAEDLVTSLYTHARFWHKSHMIENLNELLELFDAYENLRGIPEYRRLMTAADVIKGDLAGSKNVTIELLCSRPRSCLRIGLNIIRSCAVVNARTKRAIDTFNVHSRQCSCENDWEILAKNTTEIFAEIVMSAGITPMIPGTTELLSGLATTSTSAVDTDFTRSQDYYSEKSPNLSSNATVASDNATNWDTSSLISGDRSIEDVTGGFAVSLCDGECFASGCNGTNCPVGVDGCARGNCSSDGCIGDNCQSRRVCAGGECTVNPRDNKCKGSQCENNESTKTQITSIRCEEPACQEAHCENSDCSERGCENGHCTEDPDNDDDCEGSGCSINHCEGEDGENGIKMTSDCEGLDCENTVAVVSDCEGSDCHDVSLVASACEGLDCDGDSKVMPTGAFKKMICHGHNCSDSSCIGNDCGGNVTRPDCVGLDCFERCEGDDCKENSLKGVDCAGSDCQNQSPMTNDCEGLDCDSESKVMATGSLKKILCHGPNCPDMICVGNNCTNNMTRYDCTGPDCLNKSCEEDSESPNCPDNFAMASNCEGLDCQDTSDGVSDCEGESCEDNSLAARDCEGPNCENNLFVASDCEGPGCQNKSAMASDCEGPDCGIESKEVSTGSLDNAQCNGSNCLDVICVGNDCENSMTRNDCTGPDCLNKSCEGDSCQDKSASSDGCNGSNCKDPSDVVSDCEGPNCRDKSVAASDCEGPNCEDKVSVASDCVGPNCHDTTDPVRDCEGPNCDDNLFVASDCEGPDCHNKSAMASHCDGPDCDIESKVVATGSLDKAQCNGSNCLDVICVGNDCENSMTRSDCTGPDCLNKSCEGDSCQDKSPASDGCNGSNCKDTFDVVSDCKGPNCRDKSVAASDCEGPNCDDKVSVASDCVGPNCHDTTDPVRDCEGPNCDDNLFVASDCEGPDCHNKSAMASYCEGPDCDIESKVIPTGSLGKAQCNGSNCLDIICVGNDCENSMTRSDCTGPDCLNKSCEGDSCQDKSAASDGCNGSNCKDTSDVLSDCKGPNCRDKSVAASDCEGPNCEDKVSVASDCVGPNCHDTTDPVRDCEGPNCDDNLFVASDCEGPDCQDKSAMASYCEGLGCDVESKVVPTGLSDKAQCNGSNCQNVICVGNDCENSMTRSNCTGSDCLNESCEGDSCQDKSATSDGCEDPNCQDTSAVVSDCEGPNCEDKVPVASDCKGPDCHDTSDVVSECEASNCEDNPSIASDCEGLDCQNKSAMTSYCEGLDCDVDSEVMPTGLLGEIQCNGPNCPDMACVGNDCTNNMTRSDCTDPGCLEKSCEGDSCQDKSGMAGECEGPSCQDTSNVVRDCEGSSCRDKPVVASDCEGPNCEDKRSVASDCEALDCLDKPLVASDCGGPDCDNNSEMVLPRSIEEILCRGANCSDATCAGDDCETNGIRSDCTGSDCSNKSCEGNGCRDASTMCDDSDCFQESDVASDCVGLDCQDESAVASNCDGSECEDDLRINGPRSGEKEQCPGPNCSVSRCIGSDCGDNATRLECEGPRCQDGPQPVGVTLFQAIQCDGPNCPVNKTTENCEGSECFTEGLANCDGGDCSDKPAKDDCESSDCSGHVSPMDLDTIVCQGPSCISTTCEGIDCPNRGTVINCIGADCTENSTAIKCSGSHCLDNSTVQCEGLECPALDCNGPNCVENGTDIDCIGSGCLNDYPEFLCVGANCPSGPRNNSSPLSTNTSGCKDPDCTMENLKSDCSGPNCFGDEPKEEPDCSDGNCLDVSTTLENSCRGASCENDPTHNDSVDEVKEGNCGGVDCKGNVNKTCKNADCSVEYSAELDEPTTDQSCTGENCTARIVPPIEKLKRNEMTPAVSTVSPIEVARHTNGSSALPVELTSLFNSTVRRYHSTTFCGNRDPHYRRQVNRLQKMRHIDAEYTTPRVSSEEWSTLFDLPIRGSEQIRENDTENSNTNINMNLITNYQEDNPLLHVLGIVNSGLRRTKVENAEEVHPHNSRLGGDAHSVINVDPITKSTKNLDLKNGTETAKRTEKKENNIFEELGSANIGITLNHDSLENRETESTSGENRLKKMLEGRLVSESSEAAVTLVEHDKEIKDGMNSASKSVQKRLRNIYNKSTGGVGGRTTIDRAGGDGEKMEKQIMTKSMEMQKQWDGNQRRSAGSRDIEIITEKGERKIEAASMTKLMKMKNTLKKLHRENTGTFITDTESNDEDRDKGEIEKNFHRSSKVLDKIKKMQSKIAGKANVEPTIDDQNVDDESTDINAEPKSNEFQGGWDIIQRKEDGVKTSKMAVLKEDSDQGESDEDASEPDSYQGGGKSTSESIQKSRKSVREWLERQKSRKKLRSRDANSWEEGDLAKGTILPTYERDNEEILKASENSELSRRVVESRTGVNEINDAERVPLIYQAHTRRTEPWSVNHRFIIGAPPPAKKQPSHHRKPKKPM